MSLSNSRRVFTIEEVVQHFMSRLDAGDEKSVINKLAEWNHFVKDEENSENAITIVKSLNSIELIKFTLQKDIILIYHIIDKNVEKQFKKCDNISFITQNIYKLHITSVTPINIMKKTRGEGEDLISPLKKRNGKLFIDKKLNLNEKQIIKELEKNNSISVKSEKIPLNFRKRKSTEKNISFANDTHVQAQMSEKPLGDNYQKAFNTQNQDDSGNEILCIKQSNMHNYSNITNIDTDIENISYLRKTIRSDHNYENNKHKHIFKGLAINMATKEILTPKDSTGKYLRIPNVTYKCSICLSELSNKERSQLIKSQKMHFLTHVGEKNKKTKNMSVSRFIYPSLCFLVSISVSYKKDQLSKRKDKYPALIVFDKNSKLKMMWFDGNKILKPNFFFENGKNCIDYIENDEKSLIHNNVQYTISASMVPGNEDMLTFRNFQHFILLCPPKMSEPIGSKVKENIFNYFNHLKGHEIETQTIEINKLVDNILEI